MPGFMVSVLLFDTNRLEDLVDVRVDASVNYVNRQWKSDTINLL